MPRREEAVPPGCPLTITSWEIVQLLAEGLSYKEIGVRTERATSTVRTHLSNAFRALGAKNSNHLLLIVQSAGWLDYVDTDWEDERVTPGQRLYLDAFDVLLLGEAGARRFKETGIAKCDPPHSKRTPMEISRAEGLKAHHLVTVYVEAGAPTADQSPEGRTTVNQGKVAGPSVLTLAQTEEQVLEIRHEYEDGEIGEGLMARRIESVLVAGSEGKLDPTNERSFSRNK